VLRQAITGGLAFNDAEPELNALSDGAVIAFNAAATLNEPALRIAAYAALDISKLSANPCAATRHQ
jgi:hypothetical protein